KKEWAFQDIYLILQLVIRGRNGERGGADRLRVLALRLSGSPLVTLFLAMALHWCGSKEAQQEGEQLAGIADRARLAGYHWLADEAEFTAMACGVETSDGASVKKRYKVQGLTPLHRTVEKVESWPT